ncbi:MerR family transcriptional regulator [Ilyobacter polytropus]|uniref:Transcriptional regulator, MerR family n=1 Tax=Ilyobacter polytropus (strain ATCC 51220 / DSM 2926 / LMG 16218 / CuHBu1) TaxID=572544 RepID=E3H962_ILYPC|nr:MerR family transcriptional regulator [Ilyobacter polytropus]ADO82761.1 transcriptional regulator, MerR family [Ilyobacter polytropus DSM 2926]
MNIDEVAKHFHITKSKLRYYEKNGVIRKIARDKNDNRLYTKEDLLWIEFFLNLKGTGMSLKDIKHYISLKKGGIETVDERKDILLDHIELIDEKIQELILTKKDLQKQIKKYDDEKGVCIIKCSSDRKN